MYWPFLLGDQWFFENVIKKELKRLFVWKFQLYVNVEYTCVQIDTAETCYLGSCFVLAKVVEDNLEISESFKWDLFRHEHGRYLYKFYSKPKSEFWVVGIRDNQFLLYFVGFIACIPCTDVD